ncbi:Sjogren's syndrome/scleroderma autoantigen 1 family protein [Haloplanus pelagicus]|uniref:Sjogren's syndrome/scleroderma autoantigen 1 family protein n=1 Tax=Haloplanus pelagicus TaxID=2949995 RepID=UPI00203CB928|nr:Sjogren's syndrome/scleroderma autoantigen 1 family protein [Haloplanus sp. HW8-1]
MSGFDKEAERERLREKYEQDQEKRAATQRMSELLLKGATMTNSHCDACGDPIFRYEDQEFCPTCQAPDEAGTSASASAADSTSASDATPADADATTGTEATENRPTADASDPAESGATPERPAPPAVDSRERRPAPATGADADAGSGASLDDARASLSRTVVRFARAAEETDDPRRATDLLAAAREAAETLSALDDCGRF